MLSVLIGVTAGYLGGAADEGLSALSNVFLVIPALPLIIIITVDVPNAGDLADRAGHRLHLVGLGRPGAARADAVAAPAGLRRGGPGHRRDAPGGSSCFEILPNLTAIIASGFVGTVIFAVHVRDHPGLHRHLRRSPTWNWGTILFWAQGQQALAQGAWWWFVPAGLAIALLGTALSLINFGIDEFVSPRLRSAGKTKVKTVDGRTVRMRVGFTPVLAAASARAADPRRPPTHRHRKEVAPMSDEPVLEIREPERRLRPRRPGRARRPRRQPDPAPRRGARPGRRERQRQVDPGLRPDPAARRRPA